MDALSIKIKKNAGQTMVEYLLMLGMVVVIGMAVFKSDVFQDFMGPESRFFAQLRNFSEYGYRHGEIQGRKNETTNGTSIHRSYFTSEEGTRFFISKGDAYP